MGNRIVDEGAREEKGANKLMENDAKHPHFVRAVYAKQTIEEYSGNPLIEALPPIMGRADIIRLLSKEPKFDSKERELSEEFRMELIPRLNHYYEPMTPQIYFAEQIWKTIRQGYLARKPKTPAYSIKSQRSYEALMKGEFLSIEENDTKRFSPGFVFLGVSGIGKTTAVERVLNIFPKVIEHRFYKEEHLHITQVPWLKIDCSFDGSIKALCINFFSQLDQVLGTNYAERYGKKTLTVDMMMQQMTHLSHTYHLGLLVVDEIQHLSSAKSGGEAKMLNFFVTLVNTIGVPVILIGTNKALPILQSEFRQARRGAGQGNLIWERMSNNKMWEIFVRGFWGYQWTKKEAELTDEIIDVLYDESQGIVDIAIKIFMIAQMKAINNRTEKITAASLRKVVKTDLQFVEPMLSALRNGDVNRLNHYQDIAPINVDKYLREYKEPPEIKKFINAQKEKERLKRTEQHTSLKEELVTRLMDLELEAKTVEVIVNKLLKGKDVEQQDKIELLKEAIRIALEMEKGKESGQEKKKNVRKMVQNDLRSVTDTDTKKKQQVSAYELLKEKGMISNPVLQMVMSKEA